MLRIRAMERCPGAHHQPRFASPRPRLLVCPFFAVPVSVRFLVCCLYTMSTKIYVGFVCFPVCPIIRPSVRPCRVVVVDAVPVLPVHYLYCPECKLIDVRALRV
jgi:hypothetical protein